jgi:putative transposase
MGENCALKTQVTTMPLICGVVKGTQIAQPWKDGGGKAKKEGERDKSPTRTPSLMSEASLQEIKDTRPGYQGVDSGVLQLISSRINESFNNFFKGAGFPNFKPSHDGNSFPYKPARIKSL